MMAKPDGWDGDEEELETFPINKDVLIWLLARIRQPPNMNVKRLKRMFCPQAAPGLALPAGIAASWQRYGHRGTTSSI